MLLRGTLTRVTTGPLCICLATQGLIRSTPVGRVEEQLLRPDMAAEVYDPTEENEPMGDPGTIERISRQGSPHGAQRRFGGSVGGFAQAPRGCTSPRTLNAGDQ